MSSRKPVPRRRSRALIRETTREALLAAGMAEFAEKGVDSPSLDAICARAGYTRGAFYVHFRDRDDFLVAVMDRIIGPFLDAVIATGDAAHDLEHTVGRFADAVRLAREGGAGVGPERVLPPFASGVSFHRVLEACARSDELRGRVVRLLEEAVARLARAAQRGQNAQTIRRDVDAEPMAFLVLAMALGVISAFELGLGFDLERARKAALKLVARGR
jgi:AcrR family transcriptional regulator